MRFHAILLVRDEADIIQQSLEHTLRWCDAVYIYDTGSTDDTWEIIQDLARQDCRVVPFQKQPTVFSKGLRAYVFSKFRDRAAEGDWFIRLDADEFYHIPPPEFVRTKLGKHETCVYNQSYDFRLTTKDVADWESGRETVADRQRPIQERRRFFVPLKISEPRMFRYRETMQWSPDCSFPYNAGYVAQERIPIRHYPHRDPVQLQRRCTLRSIMAATSLDPGRHWLTDDWRQLVVDCNAENLQYWTPETPLPEYHFFNHLAPLPKRGLQRFAHALLLPILDQTRPQFPDNYQPERLSVEITKSLTKTIDDLSRL